MSGDIKVNGISLTDIAERARAYRDNPTGASSELVADFKKAIKHKRGCALCSKSTSWFVSAIKCWERGEMEEGDKKLNLALKSGIVKNFFVRAMPFLK